MICSDSREFQKQKSNKNNFFKRQFHESDSITFDKDDFNDSDDFESLFEIKKLLIKRIQIIQEKTKIKYLVK